MPQVPDGLNMRGFLRGGGQGGLVVIHDALQREQPEQLERIESSQAEPRMCRFLLLLEMSSDACFGKLNRGLAVPHDKP